MRTLLLPLAAMVVLAPFAKAQDWSSWKADDTYRGIEVRTRCTGYNEFAGQYLWDVQLRNRYQKRVDVTWAAEPQRLLHQPPTIGYNDQDSAASTVRPRTAWL